MITINKRLTAILGVAAVILLIPFVAMQFTTEVNWSIADFVIAGALLFSTGLCCEWVIRSVKSTRSRFIICGLILLALLLIWAELAVGIFGSPLAGS
ncbi:hypothetical protein E1176_12820 [Fulvivirga sp. RKSG066]|uniref:hypothetical protein n=1 Tax=Fulvivirga aurantia TaxID=2529383 RepID=UPI0012BD1265|nr:hypothetical protein [Fulvivirga aurantia]MTI21908.1 hypothetical protein [Fulvivirga aurantia]